MRQVDARSQSRIQNNVANRDRRGHRRTVGESEIETGQRIPGQSSLGEGWFCGV